jgi:hypothetical protein
MNDQEILDFMDANGIQCWPEWTSDHRSRNWVAQMQKPFKQCTRKTLRAAVVDIKRSLEKDETPPLNLQGEPPPLHYKD